MAEKESIFEPTVRGIIMKIDKSITSNRKAPHVYCPGQSTDYPVRCCKEYCLVYYKGLVLGGISCSYHEPRVYHLELKSDPSSGKISLTLVK